LLAIDVMNNCGLEQDTPGYAVDAVGHIDGATCDFTIQIMQYQRPATCSTVGACAMAALSLTGVCTWSNAANRVGNMTVHSGGEAKIISNTPGASGDRQTPGDR
jgi:hypothetical protein